MSGEMTNEDVTSAPAAGAAAKMPMRDRILDAATELFYAQGLHAVSAERVIAQVGITKVTFYRHFPTKDDLIVAYLERRAPWVRAGITKARISAGEAAGPSRLLAR